MEIDKWFYQVLDTINWMLNNKAEKNPSGKNTKSREP